MLMQILLIELTALYLDLGQQILLFFIQQMKQKMGAVCSRYYEQLTQEETEVLWKDVKEVEGLIHKMLDE